MCNHRRCEELNVTFQVIRLLWHIVCILSIWLKLTKLRNVSHGKCASSVPSLPVCRKQYCVSIISRVIGLFSYSRAIGPITIISAFFRTKWIDDDYNCVKTTLLVSKYRYFGAIIWMKSFVGSKCVGCSVSTPVRSDSWLFIQVSKCSDDFTRIKIEIAWISIVKHEL